MSAENLTVISEKLEAATEIAVWSKES
jgi:hypothetical protein